MLDDLSVEVDHVQGPVGTGRGEDGHEPTVPGGQELGLLEGGGAGIGRPARRHNIAVHQIVGRLCDEMGSVVRLGKPAARIDALAAGGSEVAELLQQTSLANVLKVRIVGNGIDRRRLSVVGNRLHGVVDLELGIAVQVSSLDHRMPQVIVVPGGEAVASGIEGVPELGVAADRLELQLVRLETNIRTPLEDVDGCDLGMIGEMDRLALIAELLEAAADPESRVGGVDPVVHFIEGRIDAELWIDLRETGQDHFALVGPAVPIGVGEMENVGGTGDQDPPLPGQHAMGHVEPVDKHAAVLEPAVAVPVLEQLDPGEGLVGDRIVPHLDDEQAAAFVERHGDGIHDLGFGSRQFDPETRSQLKGLESGFRRVGRFCVGAAAGENCGQDRGEPDALSQPRPRLIRSQPELSWIRNRTLMSLV